MDKNLDLTRLIKPIGRLFRHYHLTIFIVFVIACLTTAVLFLNNILNDASLADGYVPTQPNSSVDQATLDRINALHTSGDTYPDATTAAGRSNPFTE